MNVIVDADIIAYRAAFSAKDDSEKQARKTVDDICGGILYDCFYPQEYTLGENTWFYLTGGNNFRSRHRNYQTLQRKARRET